MTTSEIIKNTTPNRIGVDFYKVFAGRSRYFGTGDEYIYDGEEFAMINNDLFKINHLHESAISSFTKIVGKDL
jgi:hypothetical protein